MGQPSAESAKRVARAFADAINHQDADEIDKLMTEDHLFIDSLGSKIQGKPQMREGWKAYFRMVPDYSIAVDETLVAGAVVVMLGTVQGTYSTGGALQPENRWATPAAWRALVRDSQVAEWRVFADNEPIRQIMARNRR